MNKKIVLISSCLIVILVLGAFLYQFFKPAPLLDPAQLYQEAIEQITKDVSQTYKIKKITNTTIGCEILTETSEQVLTYTYDHAILKQIHLSESLSIGSYTIETEEIYENGRIYISLNNNHYSALFDHDVNFTPFKLISDNLYEDASANFTNNEYIIHYSAPTAAEDWAIPDGATLISANGTVTLSDAKQLLKSQYEIVYKYNGQQIEQWIETIAQEVQSEQAIDTSLYKEISDVKIPKLLEMVCAYLLEIRHVNSDYKEVISCEAFGDHRVRSINLQVNNQDLWGAELSTNVTLTNSGRPGEETKMLQTESLVGGKYTIQIDGNLVSPTQDQNADSFYTYCRDHLVGNIMLPQYIESVEIEKGEDQITLSFIPSPELSVMFAEDICQMLYSNPTVLNGIATDIEQEETKYTLTINAHTNLPEEASIDHTSIYTITNIPYALTYSATQTFEYPKIKEP